MVHLEKAVLSLSLAALLGLTVLLPPRAAESTRATEQTQSTSAAQTQSAAVAQTQSAAAAQTQSAAAVPTQEAASAQIAGTARTSGAAQRAAEGTTQDAALMQRAQAVLAAKSTVQIVEARLTDSTTNTHVGSTEGKLQLTLKVTGLVPAKEYAIRWQLFDQNGKRLTDFSTAADQVKRGADDGNGAQLQLSATVENAADLAGSTLHAKVQILHNGRPTVMVEGGAKEELKVYYPQLSAEVVDKSTGKWYGQLLTDEQVRITGTVRNLPPGQHYQLDFHADQADTPKGKQLKNVTQSKDYAAKNEEVGATFKEELTVNAQQYNASPMEVYADLQVSDGTKWTTVLPGWHSISSADDTEKAQAVLQTLTYLGIELKKEGPDLLQDTAFSVSGRRWVKLTDGSYRLFYDGESAKGKEITEQVSPDEKGNLRMMGLLPGSCDIREVQTQAGWDLLPESFRVFLETSAGQKNRELSHAYLQTLERSSDVKQGYQNVDLNVTDGHVTVPVSNSKAIVLETGGETDAPWLVPGVLCAAAALAVLGVQRRRAAAEGGRG